MRQLYRVIKEHKPTFDYFVTAEIDEVVSLGREDDEMPNGYWYKNKEGQERARKCYRFKGSVDMRAYL